MVILRTGAAGYYWVHADLGASQASSYKLYDLEQVISSFGISVSSFVKWMDNNI